MRTQRNMRVELGIALIVVIAGILFRIAAAEWAAILVCIVGMVDAGQVRTTRGARKGAVALGLDSTGCSPS